MGKELASDITIVGAGAAGLMTATRLSEQGFRVALIEKKAEIARGPSTRNEGWLHPGTYHATSIKNPEHAMEVARRCQYGYNVISHLAPEAIMEGSQSVVLFKSDEYAAYSQERWQQAQVLYESILLRELALLTPEVNTRPVTQAFRTRDKSINTPRLYENLAQRIQREGGEFFLESALMVDEDNQSWVKSYRTGEVSPLNTQLVINTTGFGMAEFLSQYFGQEYTMRFWKSHLIVYPRLGQHNVFYLEPGEAAAFQHGPYTIIGQHEDATIVDVPTYEVLPEKAAGVRAASERLYPAAAEAEYLETACLKPDLSRGQGEARSLGIEMYEPTPGYLFALPGKMTESPYLADQLVNLVLEKNIKRTAHRTAQARLIPVAARPCDEWQPEMEGDLQ